MVACTLPHRNGIFALARRSRIEQVTATGAILIPFSLTQASARASFDCTSFRQLLSLRGSFLPASSPWFLFFMSKRRLLLHLCLYVSRVIIDMCRLHGRLFILKEFNRFYR